MIQYLGLDFESSGTNPWGKHVPIQIGLDLGDGDGFSRYIGRWDWTEYEWDPEAEAVHGIPQGELGVALPVWAVDIQAAAWLLGKLGPNARMWTISVGFNVAGFDRQFITRWFPNLNRLLSYRTVDLNAVLFLMAGQREGKYVHLKKDIKRRAAEGLAVQDNEHDALWDAELALQVWRLMRTEYDGLVSPPEATYPTPKGPEALI